MVRTDFSEALYCVVLAWHFAFVMAANDRCVLCQPVAVRNSDKQNVKLLIPVQMTSSHGWRARKGKYYLYALSEHDKKKKEDRINQVYWLYFTSLFVFVKSPGLVSFSFKS